MNGIHNVANPSTSLGIKVISVNAPHNKARKLFLCFFLILFTMAAPLSLIAEETEPQGRGIFPGCQKGCFSAHKKNMEILIEKYELEGDKVSFQDAVDSALHEYSKCVANCRIPMPVK